MAKPFQPGFYAAYSAPSVPLAVGEALGTWLLINTVFHTACKGPGGANEFYGLSIGFSTLAGIGNFLNPAVLLGMTVCVAMAPPEMLGTAAAEGSPPPPKPEAPISAGSVSLLDLHYASVSQNW